MKATSILNSYKVNYSELVTALQDHNQGQANGLLKKLIPNLKTYLMVVMNASEDEAEEAVHRAFYNTYEKILTDQISSKKYIYRYLIQASRRAYVRLKKYEERFSSTPDWDSIRATPAEQIENLFDEDRQQILELCLQELPRESRVFIMYILNHPEVSTKSLSDYFDISEANVRVKKMRIIDDLSYCVKKKLEE